MTYICGTCDHTSDTYAKAEKHADTHGGARISVRIEERKPNARHRSQTRR